MESNNLIYIPRVIKKKQENCTKKNNFIKNMINMETIFNAYQKVRKTLQRIITKLIFKKYWEIRYQNLKGNLNQSHWKRMS